MNLKKKFPSESNLVKRKLSLRQFFITTFLLSIACLLGIIIVIVIEFFYGEFLDLFWYGEYFPQLVLMILIPSGIILGILSFYFIRKYRFLNRKVKRKLFYNPKLNDHILQFLIDNQKQKFTSIMIHKKLNISYIEVDLLNLFDFAEENVNSMSVVSAIRVAAELLELSIVQISRDEDPPPT